MANILISGGTGFVAHWLKKTKPANTTLYCIGRSKYESMEWYNGKWDAIIHLAPISPALMLDCAKRNKCRMLYGSSGIVYHPENNTPYRQGKIIGEQLCAESDVDYVIARMFTFYGDKLDDNKAFTAFSKAAAAGKPLVISGSGNTVRSYLHGSELGHWLWAVLKHGQTGEAYDIGSDHPVTMLELAEALAMGSKVVIQGGRDPMPWYLPEDTRKTRKLLDNSKI